MIKVQHIIMLIFLCYGCNNPGWQKKEQQKFGQECVELGLTIEQCGCILNCLEEEYINYNIAFDVILLDTVSIKMNTCVQSCNKNKRSIAKE